MSTADTDTILRAHDTKSRKLDLLEGKSHDKASIMYYRQTLADAHRILTLRATRVEYNQRWYKFKQATHRDESNNEQRSQLFSKTIESKVPASEPRSRISRSNNMRGKGEMRDQFFRRLAHKQRFLSFAAAPKTNSSSSSSNAVQLTRTSKHENWRENYLKVLCAKQQWYQTVENYATQRCRLLDQFDLAEHGIIPEGYANLVNHYIPRDLSLD
ncbi:hypothetical protein DH86_00000490 [Scytalidium sp. 3C]|nr:hypothetical protein DH86_00000490 [Scytalidium sp. 3C]